MSYVLDALKRSQQDRHQGQMPTLDDQGQLMHLQKPKQAWWPYVLIAVLALNAIALIYVFGIRDTSSPVVTDGGSPITAPVRSESVLATPEPSVAVQAPPARSDVKTNPAANITGSSNTGIDWQAKEEEARRLIEQAQSTQPVSNEYASDVPLRIDPNQAPTVYQGEQADLSGFDPAYDVIKPKQAPKGGALPFPEPVVVEEAVTTSQYANVPFLYDLSGSQRPRVPRLTFNSHIYSDTPSARRVMINNVYLGEGQSLSGLEIVEIGELNIVFRKSGTLFKLPALRDWEG